MMFIDDDDDDDGDHSSSPSLTWLSTTINISTWNITTATTISSGHVSTTIEPNTANKMNEWPSDIFNISIYLKIIIGILLVLVILVSIFGNILVCVAIASDRRLRRLGNLFLVSLAIADLCVGALVMTFALANDLMEYWPFWPQLCEIWIAFDISCSTCSIINLCAIALDRFAHIKDPMRYNRWMNKRVVVASVSIIWLVSCLISFVPISLGWHRPLPNSHISTSNALNTPSTTMASILTETPTNIVVQNNVSHNENNEHGTMLKNSNNLSSSWSTTTDRSIMEQSPNLMEQTQTINHYLVDQYTNSVKKVVQKRSLTFYGSSTSVGLPLYTPSSLSSSLNSTNRMITVSPDGHRPPNTSSTVAIISPTNFVQINDQNQHHISYYLPVPIFSEQKSLPELQQQNHLEEYDHNEDDDDYDYYNDNDGDEYDEDQEENQVYDYAEQDDIKQDDDQKHQSKRKRRQRHSRRRKRKQHKSLIETTTIGTTTEKLLSNLIQNHEFYRQQLDQQSLIAQSKTSPVDDNENRMRHQDESEWPQCSLDLTPTYAVVSSCIRLYSICQQHVKSIKSMTKLAPTNYVPPPSAPPTFPPGTSVSVGMDTNNQNIHSNNHRLNLNQNLKLNLDSTQDIKSVQNAIPSPLPQSSSSSSYNYHQQQQQQQHQSHVSEHKAAITLGIIMGTFLACWMPFFCMNIVAAYCKTCIPASVFKVLTWLGYFNSCLNPAIYSIFNTEFRDAFRRILVRYLFTNRFNGDFQPPPPPQPPPAAHPLSSSVTQGRNYFFNANDDDNKQPKVKTMGVVTTTTITTTTSDTPSMIATDHGDSDNNDHGRGDNGQQQQQNIEQGGKKQQKMDKSKEQQQQCIAGTSLRPHLHHHHHHHHRHNHHHNLQMYNSYSFDDVDRPSKSLKMAKVGTFGNRNHECKMQISSDPNLTATKMNTKPITQSEEAKAMDESYF